MCGGKLMLSSSRHLVRALPGDFRIVLADIGSAGGVHRRWHPVRPHLSTLLFDPFDTSGGTANDRVFDRALGATTGTAMLNVTRRVSMTSLLMPNAERLSQVWYKPAHTVVERQLNVDVEPLDSLVARESLRVDVAKIDTQGYEGAIIAGGRQTLSDQVFVCEVEVSFFDRYVGLTPIEGIVSEMRSLGFELVELGRPKRYYSKNGFGIAKPGSGLGNRPGRLAFADAIFLKTDAQIDAMVRARLARGDRQALLRPIVALAVYGKCDIAAALFERLESTLDDEVARRLRLWFAHVARWQGLTKLPHLALDYLARRV